MTLNPPSSRRHPRQQLVLKVEFDDTEGFRSNFLSDLSEGGLRLNTVLEVGQRLMLSISFLGFLEPIQVEAVVQWSRTEDHPEGPASGLAFVSPSDRVREWIAEVLDAKTNLLRVDHLDDLDDLDDEEEEEQEASRVLLLESHAFLREIYGQEVRNWAELREEVNLDFLAVDDPEAWKEALREAPAMLGIIDVDGLKVPGRSLYDFVRSNILTADMPLIILGTPENMASLMGLDDELLFCLRKPLRFGVLMNTVRVLARDPLPEPR